MTAVFDGIARPQALTLALSLLHFVWQGALVAALLAAVNSLLARSSARARYTAACAALLLMLAMPLMTARVLASRPRPGPVSATVLRRGSSRAAPDAGSRQAEMPSPVRRILRRAGALRALDRARLDRGRRAARGARRRRLGRGRPARSSRHAARAGGLGDTGPGARAPARDPETRRASRVAAHRSALGDRDPSSGRAPAGGPRDRDDSGPARRSARSRARPRPAPRLPGQPAAGRGRDAPLLPSRGLVGLAPHPHRAGERVRRSGGRGHRRRAPVCAGARGSGRAAPRRRRLRRPEARRRTLRRRPASPAHRPPPALRHGEQRASHDGSAGRRDRGAGRSPRGERRIRRRRSGPRRDGVRPGSARRPPRPRAPR